MNHYPIVHDEFTTIRSVAAGKSLARFGDGELKIVYGFGYAREKPNRDLSLETRKVLRTPHPDCLIGIPTMDERGPKYQNWIRHRRRFERVLSEKVDYYSAFVSRPDSAPWINCAEYAALIQEIWKGKRAVVIAEAKNSLLHLVRLSAAETIHIRCSHEGAYAYIDMYEREALSVKPDVVLMSVGPTATCLANRLASQGVQAVDLGSAGGFLLKLVSKK